MLAGKSPTAGEKAWVAAVASRKKSARKRHILVQIQAWCFMPLTPNMYFKKGEDGQDSRPTEEGNGEMDDEVVPLDMILLDYIRYVLPKYQILLPWRIGIEFLQSS